MTEEKSYQRKYNILMDGKENVGSYTSLKQAIKHAVDISLTKIVKVEVEMEIMFDDDDLKRYILMKLNPKKAFEY